MRKFIYLISTICNCRYSQNKHFCNHYRTQSGCSPSVPSLDTPYQTHPSDHHWIPVSEDTPLPQPDRRLRIAELCIATEHNGLDLVVFLLHLLNQFQTVHIRHSDIRDHQIDRMLILCSCFLSCLSV